MNNIVLCGFMGCGKSSVGRIIARKLSRDFIDTDSYIESEQNMSIAQIFEQFGEAYFRDIEHRACATLADKSGLVIATGGGALTYERNVITFKNDTVIFMDIPFDEIERRIGDNNSRPLFRDKRKARELYERRLPLYRSAADLTVTAAESKEKMADKIIGIVRVR